VAATRRAASAAATAPADDGRQGDAELAYAVHSGTELAYAGQSEAELAFTDQSEATASDAAIAAVAAAAATAGNGDEPADDDWREQLRDRCVHAFWRVFAAMTRSRRRHRRRRRRRNTDDNGQDVDSRGGTRAFRDANETLHAAIERKAPSRELLGMLVSNPHSATFRDAAFGGDLPLHVALDNVSSAEVIRELLTAHPPAAAVEDADGFLPLHTALITAACNDVVTAVMVAHPEGCHVSNAKGNSAVHLAAKHGASDDIFASLLAASPSTAATLNDAGYLPLHLAVRKRASSVMVRKLLEVHPAGAQVNPKP